jgi:hypothetical protein
LENRDKHVTVIYKITNTQAEPVSVIARMVLIRSVKVHELRSLDLLVEVFFAVDFQTLRFFFHFHFYFFSERESRERVELCVEESFFAGYGILGLVNGEREDRDDV